jgi:5-methylcytosine-specific restriction endonuclease McrA
VDGPFTPEQEKLLVQDAFDSERRRFERLKHKFAAASAADSQPRRPAIPENVRIAVWRRDSGCCARCGSRERLEYDHIIPVARGGSNTARNIELLCEACNRTKGDEVR